MFQLFIAFLMLYDINLCLLLILEKSAILASSWESVLSIKYEKTWQKVLNKLHFMRLCIYKQQTLAQFDMDIFPRSP